MFLFSLEDYGDPLDYTSNSLIFFVKFCLLAHENYDFFDGLESDLEELNETHNWIPGPLIDN